MVRLLFYFIEKEIIHLRKALAVSLCILLAAVLIPAPSQAAADPYAAALLHVKDSKQVILAEGSTKSVKATIRLYEKNGSSWQLKRVSPAVTGKSGLSFNKKEGDGATPTGMYEIGRMFGYEKKPAGVRTSYTVTNRFHYWVDDPNSVDYNKWIYYRGNPSSRWKSFERLNHELYKHAIVIRYNENPIVKNAGSAIFLHRWRTGSTPTAGCLALSESHLIVLMKWLDPDKSPKIVIGTPDSIQSDLTNSPT
ncbi:L,D-transpeptidase family protein [Domibacillus sp. A3M-37]|uniref:L,D-transpeptidase family protein n=1 Tax=Domibacillus TaxID=1433999 RepID=UPI0009E53155|nr:MULTISPECIES: L,D-transpeptidase family protein [Domibacillus]MCP3764613.1 L,D-transpeptidase family protein [Domibacillus sp. A3M-37]